MTTLAIDDFKLQNQKPIAWAGALQSDLCPKCKGKVRCIALHHFFDDDSMGLHYQCQSCGLVYHWPHSYLARGKRGGCITPISILKNLPAWFTPEYVASVEDWYDRDGCDKRGRFARRPQHP